MSDPFDTDHAASERQAEAKRRQRDESKQEIADLRWLMGQPQGRRFMWRMQARSGLYKTSFTGNSGTFFNEGRRDMGLWALDQVLQHCPEQYLQMITENRKDETNG